MIIHLPNVADKRSSTGNLCYFTDQFDNHPWENPELNQTLRNTVGELYQDQYLELLVQTIGWLWFCSIYQTVWKKVNGDVQARRRKSSEKAKDGEEEEEEGGRDPAATLQAMAGKLQLRGCVLVM